jgi:hypothetical protein
LVEVAGGTFFNDTETVQYINIEGVNGGFEVYEYKDPFGSSYSYDSSSPPKNIASFDIYSFGPDKGASTSDDITNW